MKTSSKIRSILLRLAKSALPVMLAGCSQPGLDWVGLDLFHSRDIANQSPNVNPTFLKITGLSAKSTAVASRVFNENSSPIWIVNGTCDPSSGGVAISGDIDAPITIPCTPSNGGEFSLQLNYALISPFFATVPGASRRIVVSQGQSSETTTLYRTQSTQTVQIVTDSNTLKSGMSSDVVILANDVDLTDSGTHLTNNWPMNSGISSVNIEGDGHAINGFAMDNWWSACLVNLAYGAVVKNLKLTSATLSTPIYAYASTQIGTIFCTGVSVTIDNVSVQASIVSKDPDTYVGGLIAFGSGTITNSHAAVTVTGTAAAAGGIAGLSGNALQISRTSAAGSISGNIVYSGGLVGIARADTYSDAFAKMEITSPTSGKGGGIIGAIDTNGLSISNSYSTGNVVGSGGPSAGAGPLIGDPSVYSFTISNSYFSTDASCVFCTNTYGTGKSLLQLGQASTFAGWDFSNVWTLTSGGSAPSLR